MDFKTRIPFAELLGFELIDVQPGTSHLELSLREELTNSWSVAHGGVVMTLLDVAMAVAARSPGVPDGDYQSSVVTIEMKSSFLRPGTGRLVARGHRVHRTSQLAFCEAHVYDGEGRVAAHGTGTFKYMKALPVGPGGRRIQKADASD